jgi:hypothetical protein
MIEISAASRAESPDEVGSVGALLMGPEGGFITGSDFLMDGELQPHIDMEILPQNSPRFLWFCFGTRRGVRNITDLFQTISECLRCIFW